VTTDTARYRAALGAFLSASSAYRATSSIDDLRAQDYSRLDRMGHVYLDYTGSGLYAESQLRRHQTMLVEGVFGNPHSRNPTSLASTAMVEAARASVREFFRASAEEYEVIFTANASGALKLVGESYPFTPGSKFLLTYDNHNSVNGIREFARARGASVTYLPVGARELRMDPGMVRAELAGSLSGAANLFAYPAQSNFSGVQHPLEWIDEARERGWDVILDAAAFAPTNRLDLSVVKPDFVPVSFYKMFGYPTGVGALIARRSALSKLVRPWFAGGTITIASVQGEGWHHLAPGAAGFEDGTADFLSLPAVTIGLEHLGRIGVDVVHERVTALAGWLLAQMGALTHSGGAPMVRVFGPADMTARGATIAFHLLDPMGEPYDVHQIEVLAGERRISLRTGCFCNPGDGVVAHRITADDMAKCFVEQHPVTFDECDALIRTATGKMPNTMRVSLGLVSDFADVYRFIEFVEGYRDVSAREI
jgi:selenocysteine lyase/cysteine desulfurase